MKLPVLLIALLACCQIHAQQLGGWLTTSFNINFKNKKLNGFFEAQLRANNVANNIFYNEVKGGINYKAFSNAQFLLGTGNYRTYQPQGNLKGPILVNEIRLWQQAVLTDYLSRLKIEHRFRVEQRFFKNADYRNRFRYRVNFLYPLNKKKFEKGTVYLNAHDEIFLNNKAPHFERNRLFFGTGYYLNKTLTLQAGGMNQYNYTVNNTSNQKWFAQLSLLFNINILDDREHLPTVID